MSALPPKADIARREGNFRLVPKANIGLLTHLPTLLECGRRKPPSITNPRPRGHPPRSRYIRLLPSKFRRDFVILGELRVVTPDRSASSKIVGFWGWG